MEHFDTTSNFISDHVNSSGYAAGDVIKTYGYSSLGGVGGSRWKATGNIIAASQDPLALNDIKMSDASGNEFELMVEESGIIDLNVLGGTSASYINIATSAGLTYSQGLTSDVSNDIVNQETVDTMINTAGVSVGEAHRTAEFSTGNGGGGTYDAVLTSSVTPNGFDIIQGVADPSISFVLRRGDIFNVRQWGILNNGTGDQSTGIQRVVDYAQTLVQSTFGIAAPKIYFPAGTYAIAAQITKKSAPWVGDGVDNTTIKWNGATNIPVIVQDGATARGGNSATFIEGFSLYEGDTRPQDWLLIEDNASNFGVDFGFRLREIRFRGASRYLLDIQGYVNAHWSHLRFDEWDDYAIRITPSAGQNLSTFNLSNWTADHMSGSTGQGFMLIDNTAGLSNIGTLRLADARYENNATLTGNKAFIVITTNVNDCVQLQLENLTYQDTGNVTSGDSLIYMDGTGAAPSVIFQNFNPDSLDTLFGGTLPSGWGGAKATAIPYQYANFSRQNAIAFPKTSSGSSQNMQIFLDDATAQPAIEIFRGTETNPRIEIDSDGFFRLGDGASAADTLVRRTSAGILSIDSGALNFAVHTGATATTAQLTSLTADINTEAKFNGKMVKNTTTNQMVFSSGSAAGDIWRDASGTGVHTPI